MLYEGNKEHLKDTALLYFNRKISFEELFLKVGQAASSLKSLGIEKGDIVTLQVLNMPQTIVLFYAISYIGAVANFIYVTSSVFELKDILVDTESKMYITIDSLYPKMKEALIGSKVENVLLLKIGEEADVITKMILSVKSSSKSTNTINWKSFLNSGDITTDEINEANIPVAMVYTSGTTGKSKAVVLSSNCMNALVCQYNSAGIGLSRGKTFMNSLPQFIAFGIVFAMHVPLCLGITDAIVLDPKPTSAGKYFVKYKPNYFVNGKAAIENILSNPKINKMKLDFIEVLAAGGETMPIAFEERVRDFLRGHGSDNVLSIGYGMTEVAATVVTSTPKVNRIGTVGIPLPGTIIKIVEPGTINELPYNTDGEVCFNAPTMMMGYYKQEDETNNIIKKHDDGLMWVHSGDIGRICEEGFLTIAGRIKRIIAVRENGIYHKVFPKLIEDKLETVEGVETIVLVGRTVPVIENEIVAFVKKSVNEEDKTIIDRLIEYSNTNLDSWERPCEYRIIPDIPRSTVGKIDYKELEKRCQKE